MNILRRIESIKKDNKLNNKDLAELWGISEETVKSYWRKAKAPNIPKPYLEKLADRFNVDKDWLMKGKSVENIYIRDTVEQVATPKSDTPKESLEYFKPKVDFSQLGDSETAAGMIAYYNGTSMSYPIEVLNHKIPPTYQMYIPEYADCSFSFSVYGHDMSPKLEPGTIVLCRPVINKEQIKYGSIHFLITPDFQMFRRLLKADNEDYIIASADNEALNKAGKRVYEDMLIAKKDITVLYLVKAALERLET